MKCEIEHAWNTINITMKSGKKEESVEIYDGEVQSLICFVNVMPKHDVNYVIQTEENQLLNRKNLNSSFTKLFPRFIRYSLSYCNPHHIITLSESKQTYPFRVTCVKWLLYKSKSRRFSVEIWSIMRMLYWVIEKVMNYLIVPMDYYEYTII